MKSLRVLCCRIRGLFKRNDELDAELESHLQFQVEDNVRAGMSPEEAGRQARIKLGGVEQTRQAVRERSTLPFVESLAQDIRIATRTMVCNPAFTAVVVLTLAIGIGTSTTVFSWINATLLQPLAGVADPSRLVVVESVAANHELVPNSYPDFQDFRDHLHLFDMAVSHPAFFSVGNQDHADRVWGELVSGNFFAVLGVHAAVGRVFLPTEYGDKPGAFPVVVISNRYWHSHFNGDPSIIGRTLRINQHQLTIVGVAPVRFHGSMPVTAYDLWIPYMQQPVLNGVQEWMLRNRQNRNMLGIARLKPGVTIDQATAELAALATRMAVANADVSEGMSATMLPVWKSPHGPQAMLVAPLRILMAVSLLVLLIACANVANLLLARAVGREREFIARLALGATRSRLARQILTEALVLALASGIISILLTIWMSRALGFLLPRGQSALALNLDWNARVLLFTLALCILTALAASIAPALHIRTLNLSAKLNEGSRTGTAGTRLQSLRSILVIAEIALALTAVIGAAVSARGFQTTRQIKPGFDPSHVLLSHFYLNTSGYTLDQRKEFCRRLADKLQTTPGVTDTAYSDGVPLGLETSWWEELNIEGYTPSPGENMKIFRNVISPEYLGLLHIPLVKGRDFTEHDDDKADGVMIVNQEFVRRYLRGRNPIGRRVHGWGYWFTVIGVAADSKYHSLGESPLPYTYFAFRQLYRADMNLAFYTRSRQSPDALINTVLQKVHELDPNVTAVDSIPMEEYIAASLYPQKIAATLLGCMGTLALLLAAVGIYSLMAYSVVQRTREIGIRMALGATPGYVVTTIVRQALILCAAGLPAGTLLTMALGHALAALPSAGSYLNVGPKLLGMSAANPLIYLSAAIFLAVVTTLAAVIPARRAARIEPATALRAE